MRIIINGEELEAKALLEAPKYAVQALQRQTGLTLAELYKKGNDPADPEREVFTTQVIEFLTEHSRGHRVTWKELGDRPLPILLPDAKDEAQAQERGEDSEDGEDPTRARTDSPADAAPAAHAPKAKTRKSHGSSKKNRGSKGKSTSGSSTSSTSSPA